MVDIKQNLGLCIALSAVGGVLEVFATAILAYPDAQAKAGAPWSAVRLKLCLFVNIVLQILASVVGNMFAPWYGPVSIVGPTFLSAQLVANMVIYGSLLGLECFTKDMRIGTAVIVSAAVLLPVVGPGVQSDQDATDLLEQWYSYVWNMVLLVGMFGSALLLVVKVLSCCQRDPLRGTALRYGVLLTARATAFSVNLSYSKVFVLNPGTVGLIISIILKVFSGAVMTGAIVVQSTAVSQNTFVPLNATCVILVNAITGIIIWEDWRVVDSWLGYATVVVQLIIGSYLLLGEISLFSAENKRYGRRLVLRRIRGTKELHISEVECIDDKFSDEEEGERVSDSDYIKGQPEQEKTEDTMEVQDGVLLDSIRPSMTDDWKASDQNASLARIWMESAAATAGAQGGTDQPTPPATAVSWENMAQPSAPAPPPAPQNIASGSAHSDVANIAASLDITQLTPPPPPPKQVTTTSPVPSTPPTTGPKRPHPLKRSSSRKKSIGSLSRPATMTRRVVTTSELPTAPAPGSPGGDTAASTPTTAPGHRRMQSTGGIGLVNSSTRRANQQQLRYYQHHDRHHDHDPEAARNRKEAWGRVLGIDDDWLDRRSRERTLGRIAE